MQFLKKGCIFLKNKIRELEKEIRKTRSPYRKRDLYKHLKRLLKAENYSTKISKKIQNKSKICKKNQNFANIKNEVQNADS